MSTSTHERLSLEVTDVQAEARDVVLIELRATDRSLLPPFEPGAHVEVTLPNGLVRHYSLTNDWRERDRYVVGVGRAPNSRGGSSYLHQAVRCAMTLSVGAPRNNFALDQTAGRYLFVAGGIGITPIVAMIHLCEAQCRPWRLVYAARNGQRAAFYETLQAYGERVRFHFDDLHGGVLDVREVLAGVGEDEHVYCCGPQPLIGAVQTHSPHLASSRVHFEYFGAPVEPARAAAPAGGFELQLRKSGLSLWVPRDKSILEVLEENGLTVPSACRKGVCRSCECTVCDGDVEHLDYVLSDEERHEGRSMMVCVSRSKSGMLVLDL